MQQLTAEEKIQSIEQQIRACEMGLTDAIHCPYCDQFNRDGLALCCNRFAAAALAIVERKSLDENIENAERIADQVSRN